VRLLLFALVGDRALAPSSKPVAAEWASEDIAIRGSKCSATGSNRS
jgi:hypothetical protein